MTTDFRFRMWWLAIIVAVAMVGCGKKGPLYLPDEPPPKLLAPGK